jgi:hypothetical protein
MLSDVPAAMHRTRLVMLGTGTPLADPDRAGPSLAIVVDDVACVVDAGPGLVRRAAAAARETSSRRYSSKLAISSRVTSSTFCPAKPSKTARWAAREKTSLRVA